MFRLLPDPVTASRSLGVLTGGGNDDPAPLNSTTHVDPFPPAMVTGLTTVRVPTLAPGLSVEPAWNVVDDAVSVPLPPSVPPDPTVMGCVAVPSVPCASRV